MDLLLTNINISVVYLLTLLVFWDWHFKLMPHSARTKETTEMHVQNPFSNRAETQSIHLNVYIGSITHLLVRRPTSMFSAQRYAVIASPHPAVKSKRSFSAQLSCH